MKILKNPKLSGVIIFILAFIVFAPSVDNDFVWDDVIDIKNQYFRYQEYDFAPQFIRISTSDEGASYYRPLHHLSYVLDYKLWGENPAGFHITNILLFSITCVLLYFLILLILKESHTGAREYIAFLGTVYFIVHPIHVESVSWIAGRTDILCALFFIAAFIFHLKSVRNAKYIFPAVIMLFMSFFSKEIAATFPFIVLFWHLSSAKRRTQNFVFPVIIYFIVLGLYLYMRGGVFGGTPVISGQVTQNSSSDGGGLLLNIWSSVRVMLGAYMYYFVKLVFPFSLNPFVTSVPQSVYWIFASVCSFAALLYFWIRSVFRGNGIVAFSVTWIILTLGPAILVAVFAIATTPVAERYLFLPSAGLAIIAGYVLARIDGSTVSRKIIYGIVALFLFSHLIMTVQAQSLWDDRLTLWEVVSSKSGDSAVPLINYGMALIEEGQIDSGIGKLEKALESDMNANPALKSIAANNLGIAYLGKNDLDNAEKWFREGVSYNPEFHKSYYHLGLIHFKRARFGDRQQELYYADRLFKKAIEVHSGYARAYLMLAKINMILGNVPRAKYYAQQALESGLETPLDSQAIQIINYR